MKQLIMVTAALTAISTGAFAECPSASCITFKSSAGKFAVSQNVEVGDRAGHIVRVFDSRQQPANAAVNGQKIIEVSARGTADLTDGEGNGAGYMVLTAENGDKLFTRGSLMAKRVNGKPFTQWVTNIEGGTGKLAGLHGTAKLESNFDPMPGGATSNTTYEIELNK